MFRKSREQWGALYGKVDERTKAVVYQGDAYAGRFLLFAVLIDVFIRGFRFFDPITASNLDLMFIVIAGGLISLVFQIKRRVIFNAPHTRNMMYLLIILAVAAVVAFGIALMLEL
ncbi:MAG: hypothetical protein GX936_10560 [Clostridiales bacterium]|nr:hypothetical protein [Clostridiales bacterium]